MKTIFARDAVISYSINATKLIHGVRTLDRRIAYEGNNIVIADGLDDVRRHLEKALDLLDDLECALDDMIDDGHTEIEEVE